MAITKLSKEARTYLASIGAKGGKAGTGKNKLRGTTEYYKTISRKAAAARKAKKK